MRKGVLALLNTTLRRIDDLSLSFFLSIVFPHPLSSLAGIGGISSDLFWLFVDTLKELNIKFWVWAFSFRGGLFSMRFLFVLFRKVWLQVLTNICFRFTCVLFTTGLSWWNDFSFIYFDRIYILLAFWTRRRLRSFFFHLKSYILKRFPQ